MACGRKKSMPAHRFLFFRRPPYAPVSLPGLQFLLQNRSIGLFPFSRLSLVRFYSSLCPLFLHRADSECFFHRKHSKLPCYAPLTPESGQIHFLNFICRKLYIVSMRTDLLRCILTFFSFHSSKFCLPTQISSSFSSRNVTRSEISSSSDTFTDVMTGRPAACASTPTIGNPS